MLCIGMRAAKKLSADRRSFRLPGNNPYNNIFKFYHKSIASGSSYRVHLFIEHIFYGPLCNVGERLSTSLALGWR
jgi:hypothetical protein